MKKYIYIFTIFVVVLIISSCKINYQKLSTEFIRNLPDSCEFLIQVENEIDHLVYYKSTSNNYFYCYNFEIENNKKINVPKVESFTGENTALVAGSDNILVIYCDVNDINNPTIYDETLIQLYNLKTQSFKDFLQCDGYKVDEGKKQLICYVFETDRTGEGTRKDEIYDFDGKLLSKKEVEVIDFEEVPDGTIAAKNQALLDQYQKANRLSLWECVWCKQRIPSKGKPGGICSGIIPHQWRRISYLE